MSDVELGISYWLAQTQFTITLARRNVMETGTFGSYARPVVDIVIAPNAVADPTSRQSLTVDSGLLAKLSLTINLDERGLIESLASDAGGSGSPVINMVGNAVNHSATTAVTASLPMGGALRSRPLEEAWGHTNGQLASHAAEIEANIGRLLNEIGHADATAASILESGHALELLQSQLAAISQVKLAWLTAQGRETERGVWQLTSSELLHIVDSELPPYLADGAVSGPLAEMANRFGVLIAIADRDRADTDLPMAEDLQDTLVLRRTRPATVGAYLRDDDGGWRLEEPSVLALDILDEFSGVDYVSLDGSWLRGKSFTLAFHPDMSLKTVGLTDAGRASAGATSESRVERVAKPLIAPRAPAEQRSGSDPMELPSTSSDYEVLAATRARAGELTIHEQRRKISDDA
jgi:hypothetical protein